MDLNLLVAFDAFMREGNVTRAGRRLGISQSAASGILARLRTLFDDPLFVRSRGGIEPTRMAEELIGPIRDGLAQLQDALDYEREFDSQASTRSFRLAMSDSASLILLPKLIGFMQTNAPATALRVTRLVDHQVDDVLERDVELAIGVIGRSPAGILKRTVLEDDTVCMVRRGNPLAASRLTVKRFAAAAHMLVSPRGKERGRMDAILDKQGLSRRVEIVVPDWTVAATILASTEYVLTVSEAIASALAPAHDLVVLALPKSLRATSPLACAWHGRLNNDSGHRWLREAVARVADDL